MQRRLGQKGIKNRISQTTRKKEDNRNTNQMETIRYLIEGNKISLVVGRLDKNHAIL